MVPTLAVCELCSQPSFLSPLKLGSFQIAKSCERVLQRFTAAPQASSLLEPFRGVWNPFRPRRHRVSPSPTVRSCATASAPGRRWSARHRVP